MNENTTANDNAGNSAKSAISLTDLAKAMNVDEDTLIKWIAVHMSKRPEFTAALVTAGIVAAIATDKGEFPASFPPR